MNAMFFVFGSGSKTVPLSSILCTMTCPVCGRATAFHLCWFYDYFHFFFIPLFKYNHRYVATCGSCASAFQVDTEAGHAIRRGRGTLSPSHLTLLRGNSARVCPGCGRQNPSGSEYCNGCGRRL